MTVNRSTIWDKRHIFHYDNHSGRCKSIRNHLFQSPLCLKQFCLILWTPKLRSTFCIDVSRSTSVGCNLERKLQPTAFSFKIAVRRSTSEYSERERKRSLSLNRSLPPVISTLTSVPTCGALPHYSDLGICHG